MKTTVIITTDILECGAGKCPNCGLWAEIPSDYTSQFMIWCWECQGRYVINMNKKTKSQIDLQQEMKAEKKGILNFMKEYTEEQRGFDYEIYEMELYMIKKVCTHDMFDNFFRDTKEEKIVKNMRFGFGFVYGDEKFGQFLSIKEYKYADYSERKNLTESPVYEIKKYIDFPVYIPVNSYNLLKPLEKYPDDLFLNDEQEKLLICEDENGNEFLVTFGGD